MPQAMICFENAGNFCLILMALSSAKGEAITGEHKQKIIEYFDNCPQELKSQNLAAMLVFIRFMIFYNERVRLKAACAVFEGHMEAFAETREQKNALWMEYERLLSLTNRPTTWEAGGATANRCGKWKFRRQACIQSAWTMINTTLMN